MPRSFATRHPLCILLSLLLASTLVACGGSDAEQEPQADAMVDITNADGGADLTEEDVAADETEDAPWTPPELVGVPSIEDMNPDEDIVEVALTAAVTPVTLDDGLTLDMFTYNGTYPGPAIQAKVGDQVIVHFNNQLDEPTTIHWHGMRIPDEMDGNPRIQDPVEPGGTFTYQFTVPEAGTFWYHPHVRSNVQVERGLYGSFIVHDPEDVQYARERVVMVDDILLDGDDFAGFLTSHPEIMHGRTGNALSINGHLQPVLADAEQGTVERWRIVNTANARTFTLALGGRSRIIATDGGRLATPYSRPTFDVAVGQRYDLEVYLDDPGEVDLDAHILVQNDAGELVTEAFPLYGVDAAPSDKVLVAPAVPDHIAPPEERPIDRYETIVLDAREGGPYGLEWTINGEANAEEPIFTFQKGDVVHFTIENNAGPEHPFHLHGQFFEIVSRNEPGIKDTVLVPGLSTVEIVAWMDNPGEWMAHCHILEHAELGMMSHILVTE